MKFKKNDLVSIDLSALGSIVMVDWSSGEPSQMPVKYYKVLTCRRTDTGIEYRLKGYSGWWKEEHLRLKPEVAKSSLSRDEASSPCTLQDEEINCDTDDSGESEDLWGVIAELSEIRAGYDLFSSKEQAKYHALTVAINKLREDAGK